MTHHDPRTAEMIATARAELATSLAQLSGADRIAAARRACDSCGGSLIAPSLPWGPQDWTLSLLGVAASGPTEAAAVADWIKAAGRCAEGDAA